MLKVSHLSGGYNGNEVLRDISFQVDKGEMFGLLGPNGSGKTTLLKMVTGLIPHQGEVLLEGDPINGFKPKELARKVAVLPQGTEGVFPYSVEETVSLGRYARRSGLFMPMGEEDEKAIEKAMRMANILPLRDQSLDRLSGGERQRVFLAQALAQEPELLILDEPTNHLDLSHQKSLLDQLKQWTRTGALTVIAVFHDVNLAALYCDRLLLLERGTTRCIGRADEVLEEERIRNVYGTEVKKLPHPEVAKPNIVIVPQVGEAAAHNVDEAFFHLEAQKISYKAAVPLKALYITRSGSGQKWKRRFGVAAGRPRTEASSEDLFLGAPEDALFRSRTATIEREGLKAVAMLATDQHLNAHLWVMLDAEMSEAAFLEALGEASRLLAVKNVRQSDGSIVIAGAQTGPQVGRASADSPVGCLIKDILNALIVQVCHKNENAEVE